MDNTRHFAQIYTQCDSLRHGAGIVIAGHPHYNEHCELTDIAAACLTKHLPHHYLGFAATQWKLFLKDTPPRFKPLLYIYRVLLTGIHLMISGKCEANLLRPNELFQPPHICDLIERKAAGTEKGTLEQSDLGFYNREYERLQTDLEQAIENSQLPE